MTDSERLKKIKFRASRRGFREADILLGLFAEAEVESLSPQETALFEALLEQPDQHLYAWIIGREETPLEFQNPVMEKIRAFVPLAHQRLLATLT